MAGENPQTTMPPVPREPIIRMEKDRNGQTTATMPEGWTRWIQQIQRILSFSGGIAWQIVNKAGSRLSDIVTRPHSDLQNVEGTGTRHISESENNEVTALDSLPPGVVAKTGDAAYSARTITGTSGEVEVSNGTGVAGNPVIGLPELISTPRKFGTETDNTEFEADGTQKKNGAATTWVDVDFPVIVKTTGAGVPALATLQGNIQMLQWAVNDAQQIEVKEQIHLWKEESTGYWHCHIITGGTDVTDRYIRFEIEWTWANFGSTIAANTITTSPDMLIPANTPALTHIAFDIGEATFPSGKIAAHIKARAKRVASAGTAPTANPFCEMFQLHVECDTDGSRQQWVK